MTQRLLTTLGMMFLILGHQGISLALDCPPYPQQTKEDWRVEVEAALAKIGRIFGLEGNIKVKHATEGVLEKFPNADRVYLESTFYVGICSALRDDKSLSDSQKTQGLKEHIAEVRKALWPQAPISKKPTGPPTPSMQPAQEKGSKARSKGSLPVITPAQTKTNQPEGEREIVLAEREANKGVQLVFAPQIELEILPQPPGPELRFYNIRFMVRNNGKNTADKFYYDFIFPYDTLFPESERFGKGDRSLMLDSDRRVLKSEDRKFYGMERLYTNPIFAGRAMNVGNLSLMEPLKDFNVRWELAWEGGAASGIMTFENGKLRVEPSGRR